jgi:hypothetical protein
MRIVGALVSGGAIVTALAAPAAAAPQPPAAGRQQQSAAAAAPEEAVSALHPHNLCWIEFGTKELQAAKDFFSKVFGWKFEPFGEGYEIFTPPAGLMGGFSSRAPEGTQRTLPFIYAPDVNAALVGIEAAGGVKIFGPERIPDAGHIAFFTDPAGTIYGLADMYMTVEHSPDPFGMNGGDKPQNFTICSIELFGGDFAQTSGFFGSQFAWSFRETMPHYMSFNPGSGVSGVYQNHTPGTKALAYIWADDLDSAVQAVKDNGGKLMGDVINVGWMGRFAYFTAPGGIEMGLIGKAAD